MELSFNFLLPMKHDLWFLWIRIYILVFLHVAARSHICCLQFLCRTNLPSLKREGGDLFCIACTRQREGDVRTPLAGFSSLFMAGCLYKGQSKESPQSFPQNTFYRSCVRFFHLFEAPHHTGLSVMQFIEIMNSEQKRK